MFASRTDSFLSNVTTGFYKGVYIMKLKKIIIAIGLGACLLMTGCNNDFARKEYDSNEDIEFEMLFTEPQ